MPLILYCARKAILPHSLSCISPSVKRLKQVVGCFRIGSDLEMSSAFRQGLFRIDGLLLVADYYLGFPFCLTGSEG